MVDMSKVYINHLVQDAVNKIADRIDNSGDNLVRETVQIFLRQTAFTGFYNALVLEGRHYEDENFFRTFAWHWRLLRGIACDSPFFNKLARDRKKIRRLVQKGQLLKLYRNYFERTEVKRDNRKVPREQGSFFAKLTHCICPCKYAPMDTRVRAFLGLQNTCSVVSFEVITNSYHQWRKQNARRMTRLKKVAVKADDKDRLRVRDLSDLRILDMILWRAADKNVPIPLEIN